MAPKVRVSLSLLLITFSLFFMQTICPVISWKTEFPDDPIIPHASAQQLTASSNLASAKVRVNVSNICDKDQMRVTIRTNKPFFGLIHTRDKRRKQACSLEGTGQQAYQFNIHYSLQAADPLHCGVVNHQTSSNKSLLANHNQWTLSVVMVVRLHKNIESSEDRFFLLSCANRCVRQDCSSSNNLSKTDQTSLRALVAVEPQLPADNKSPVSSEIFTGPLNLQSESSSGFAQTHYNCELKFRWLVYLCLTLASILALSLSIAIFLCSALQKVTRGARVKQRSSSKQVLYQTSNVSAISPAVAAPPVIGSATPGKTSWSATATASSQDLSEAIAYLTSQQDVPIIGRSQQQQQQRYAQIKRRRSIGASALLNETTSNLNANTRARSQLELNNPLSELNMRSPSRTILQHEHNQDSFKTSPFGLPREETNILDNKPSEELSGEIVHDFIHGPQQSMMFNRLTQDDISCILVAENQLNSQQWPHLVIANPSAQNWYNNNNNNNPDKDNNNSLSLSTVTSQIKQVTSNQAQQSQSQFDPHKSRQLIDLLQHKHNQQIAQAKRTAATLHNAGNQAQDRSQLNQAYAVHPWMQ